MGSSAFVHETALVEPGAQLGEDTKIWHHAQVRRGAKVGARCIVGKGVFIDFDVVIGEDCKLQNYVCVYHGVTLERGVFLGPHAVFTNDLRPRATAPDFTPLRDGDWEVGETRVGAGAAIGANVTIVAGSNIGAWAMIGAGSVVTREVPAYALVAGSPARLLGYVCPCGARADGGPLCRRGHELPADHPLRR